MKGQKKPATRPAALKASIQDIESRIYRRRANIGTAMGSAALNFERGIVSPGALIAAGLLGAAMQRNYQLHGLSMIGMLQTANSGLRLLLTAAHRANAAQK